MGRVDRNSNLEEKVLSRTQRNQDMYKDVYLNNTLIDIGDLNKQEEFVEEEIVPRTYEEKDYNIDNYLMNAKTRKVDDNLSRSLDNTDCDVNMIQEKKDEISLLIESIKEKEKNEDFFIDLLADSDETSVIPQNETKLENVIGDETVIEKMEEDALEIQKNEEDFNDVEEDVVKEKKVNPAIIVFSIMLFILIMVILFILI